MENRVPRSCLEALRIKQRQIRTLEPYRARDRRAAGPVEKAEDSARRYRLSGSGLAHQRDRKK